MSAKITIFFKMYGFDAAFFQATKRTSVQPPNAHRCAYEKSRLHSRPLCSYTITL